jgi:hypothetical protein
MNGSPTPRSGKQRRPAFWAMSWRPPLSSTTRSMLRSPTPPPRSILRAKTRASSRSVPTTSSIRSMWRSCCDARTGSAQLHQYLDRPDRARRHVWENRREVAARIASPSGEVSRAGWARRQGARLAGARNARTLLESTTGDTYRNAFLQRMDGLDSVSREFALISLRSLFRRDPGARSAGRPAGCSAAIWCCYWW